MKTVDGIRLTDAEQKVLYALTEDEYFVWDTPHRRTPSKGFASSVDLPRASVPGVISSLVKKGLVERLEVAGKGHFGRDSYIRLTDVGVEVTRSLYPERVTGWPHQDVDIMAMEEAFDKTYKAVRGDENPRRDVRIDPPSIR